MWEPPARTGVSTLAVFVLAMSTLLAVPAAQSAPAAGRLPATVWAYQPQQTGEAAATADARRLKAGGMNAILAADSGLTGARAATLRRAAVRSGLRLFVHVGVRKGNVKAACALSKRLGSACALRAPDARRATAFARRPGVSFAVLRVPNGGRLLRLKLPATGRVLAIVPAPRAQLNTALWRRALDRARRSPHLDVAFSGSLAGATGEQLLGLVRGVEKRTAGAADAAPSSPSGLATTSRAATAIAIRWSPAAPEESIAEYGVYVADQRVASTAGLAWTFNGLACGTSYTFAVDALAAAGKRSARAAISAATTACSGGGGGGGGGSVVDLLPPSIPSGLASTGTTATSVSLAWASSTDDVAVAGYGLYVGSARVGQTSLRTYVFGGLTCGTSHALGVDAYDAAGNRSARASLSAATTACPAGGGDTSAPTAPTGLAVSATGTTSLTLGWNASSDNVGVTGYSVYSNNVLVSSGTARTHTLGSLTCTTSYTLAVEAYDAAGNRSPRTSVSASTLVCPPPVVDATAPSTPPNLAKTTSTQTSISVSWSGATDNVAVTGYGLYRNGTSTGSAAATARAATFSGLVCATTYTLAVDAVDLAGNRSAKSTISAATSACSAPPPPGSSASVYLSPSGSDSNACTSAAPCKTFDRGFRVAAPGAVVELASGFYTGQQDIPAVAKASTTRITFRPAAGASVTVESLDVHGSHVEIQNVSISRDFYTKCNSNDVVLRNSKAQLMFIRSSSNVSIYDSEFGNVANSVSQIGPGDGCSTSPVNVLLDGIYMHDYYSSPFNSVHEECLMVTGVAGITIRRSKFHRCEDFDILFKRYGTTTMLTDITLENNWFDVPYPDGTSAIQFSDDGDTFTNLVIRNNSFGGTLTLKPGVNYANARVIGNVGTRGPCLPSVTSAYNVWSGTDPCSATDQRAATGFVNQSGFDFHLTPSAAAVGKGHPSDYPSADLDGDSRPRGGAPDAGADEL